MSILDNPENHHDAHDSKLYETLYLFFAKNWYDALAYFKTVIDKANNETGGSGSLFVSTANVTQTSRQAIITAMRYLQISRLELLLRVSNYTNEVEEGKREVVNLFEKEQNIFLCGTFKFDEQTLNNLANNPIEINITNHDLSGTDAIKAVIHKARILTNYSLYLAIVYKEKNGTKYLYVYRPNTNNYDSFLGLTKNAQVSRNSSGIKITHRNFLKELEEDVVINKGVLIYSLF